MKTKHTFGYNVRRNENEAYKDTCHKKSEGIHEKRWMRRMPDILSVSMQDILYSRKPEL
jgi:hypothetical protein